MWQGKISSLYLSAQESETGLFFLHKISLRCTVDRASLLASLPLPVFPSPLSSPSNQNPLFFLSHQFNAVTAAVLEREEQFSPTGRTEATNGKEIGNACEIPNRTGKNNTVNYGSLEPLRACHGVVCPHGLARRWDAVVRQRCRRGAGNPARPGQTPPGAAGPGPRGQLWGQRPRRPSTGSPLFPGAPAGTPNAGSALRAERGRTGDARATRGPCGWRPPPGRAGRAASVVPRSSVRHLRESAGARGASSHSGRPSGRLSSRATCEEGEVKVKRCGGLRRARKPRPSVRARSRARQPHLALCLPSGADVL